MTESATPGASSPRDANREAPPQVARTCAATVAKSSGSNLPSSEVLLQNALSVMQSLATALQNTAQAPVQNVHPRVKVDMPTYTGYHYCKSSNEYLNRLLHYQQATGLSHAELFKRVVPVSLRDQAAR
ncbi:hypothetical protein HPB51_021032 [Rhipicephalus microplus]|uniref:Uncharacterized protein n=1 Tax=Rhipicephalus microplus TaxID=6941 RepID=A0A9J6DD01_RHIMP|nr:hypothetical protein HPB51_021032 [Rhipicephalus microplus]